MTPLGRLYMWMQNSSCGCASVLLALGTLVWAWLHRLGQVVGGPERTMRKGGE